MSLERSSRLKRSVEAAGAVAAFWYLSRLLTSAFMIRSSPNSPSKRVTEENVGRLPHASERDMGKVLLKALPEATINYEPLTVVLEPHEITPGLAQRETTPDFEVGDVYIEAGYVPKNHESKLAQAEVMKKAGVTTYVQILAEDLDRLVRSEDPRPLLRELTNGLLG
jgi:hypothetical protein